MPLPPVYQENSEIWRRNPKYSVLTQILSKKEKVPPVDVHKYSEVAYAPRTACWCVKTVQLPLPHNLV